MESNNIIDKRTKGEWKFEFDDGSKSGLRVFSGNTQIVDFVGGENIAEAEANASFICKAVNNYDSLLRALKLAANEYKNESFSSDTYMVIGEAIQKAEQ